jgi:cytochrome c peroxidase
MFFVALIAFAIPYSPTNALSRPAQPGDSPVMPTGTPLKIKAPLGLPQVPIPAADPPTTESVVLSRGLYYDPLFSGDTRSRILPSSAIGFTDIHSASIGGGDKKRTRHSPTVINSAYSSLQFRDGRAPSLEEQAKRPIENPVEKATTHSVVVKRLALFKQACGACGTEDITIEIVVNSIPSFGGTVLSGNLGSVAFITARTKKGAVASAQGWLQLFVDPKKGNCAVCHTIGRRLCALDRQQFSELQHWSRYERKMVDLGRCDVAKNEADWGAFKTPTLRNISQRGPTCTMILSFP